MVVTKVVFSSGRPVTAFLMHLLLKQAVYLWFCGFKLQPIYDALYFLLLVLVIESTY